MNKINVLLVGESWITHSSHIKGFDHFPTSNYETGHYYLKKALEKIGNINLVHLPSHQATEEFPDSLDGLKEYDVIMLSDIGSNSLLLNRKVFLEGEVAPNRLKLISEWVSNGGGFCMAGGYLSFGGFQGAAKYHNTPIEPILPVDVYPYDDRVEVPEGVVSTLIDPNHQILKGVDSDWPFLLGYQEAILKKEAQLLVETNYGHPLLATMAYGKGRTMAWMSDIGPHWCPKTFAEWEGYEKIWQQAIAWLAYK